MIPDEAGLFTFGDVLGFKNPRGASTFQIPTVQTEMCGLRRGAVGLLGQKYEYAL